MIYFSLLSSVVFSYNWLIQFFFFLICVPLDLVIVGRDVLAPVGMGRRNCPELSKLGLDLLISEKKKKKQSCDLGFGFSHEIATRW